MSPLHEHWTELYRRMLTIRRFEERAARMYAVAEVETDKVTSAVEATFSGQITRILVQPNTTVKVLTPIAEAQETCA